jgi:molybdate transport system substrate-binding protein
VFDQLDDQFQAANPGVSVKLNYGGSTDLAAQILQGARVDVFATANTATMNTVATAGLLDSAPTVFATNQLQIVVARGNPKSIARFADLSKPGITVVVETPQEPAGAATRNLEQATGVTLHPVSEELDVNLVLSKVATGNADAGVVYVTDVRAANGKVQAVDLPEAALVTNTYPIAVLKNSAQPDLARQFVALVLSSTGQQVLTRAGFGRP